MKAIVLLCIEVLHKPGTDTNQENCREMKQSRESRSKFGECRRGLQRFLKALRWNRRDAPQCSTNSNQCSNMHLSSHTTLQAVHESDYETNGGMLSERLSANEKKSLMKFFLSQDQSHDVDLARMRSKL